MNRLDLINIVPGQSLIIPTSIYTVQPGDTLFTIAKTALVSLEQLRVAKPSVSPDTLQPGTEVVIHTISNYTASIFNYYVIRTPEFDSFLMNDFAPYSTYIAMFDYQFNTNGDIVNELNDQTAIEEAWKNRVVLLVTITNLVLEGFSTELSHHVLNNPTSRTNLVNNIVNLVSRKGYGGVSIDFERIGAGDRDLFTGFLSELKNRLDEQNYLLTVALPPKTSENIPWLQGYDYGGIGSIVDLMSIMAYDWHHTGNGPGPVAPINEVRETINFATGRVPRDKIILRIPMYGYDWTIPYTPGSTAFAISNEDVINVAMKNQSIIQYSEQFATPFF